MVVALVLALASGCLVVMLVRLWRAQARAYHDWVQVWETRYGKTESGVRRVD